MLALAGCDDDSGDSSEQKPKPAPVVNEAPAQPAKPPASDKAEGFTGVHAENYEIAKAACGAFPPRELAKEYGTSTDPFEIAEAYAAGYMEAFQQANFEGCLAGLGIR